MIYALGAFDGFHLGHQRLLDKARACGESKSEGWGVITFANHPRTLFNKGNFKLLFSDRERDLIARYLKIPRMLKLTFDRMLANMLPEDFISFLGTKNNVTGLVIGSNFRFGRARSGTPETLKDICARRGWSLDVVEPCKIDGTMVSSSAVRDFILRGQIENGVRFLGYPFLVSGRVIKGDGRGRTMGFATANLAVNHHKIYPARGSYAAYTFIDDRWYPVALNIGFNPTFDLARRLRCEAHLINYEGNLYDNELILLVYAKNRDEMKFTGENALKTQLARDMENIKRLAAGYTADNQRIFRGLETVL